MRITHIVSGDLWAGAEAMAYCLVRELLLFPDLDISVILLNRGTLAEKLGALPVELIVLDERKSSFVNLLSCARQEVKHRQPHVIHAHRYKENILAWFACQGVKGAKLVATQHGLPEDTTGKLGLKVNLVSQLNIWLLSHRFARVVGVSSAVCDYLKTKNSGEEKHVVKIHNGIIPLDSYREHTEGRGLNVGSAGRLFPVKDYALMVDVCQQMSEGLSVDHFSLAGDGPQKKFLELKVKKASLSNRFSFLGHSENLADFYKNLDVYINTSIHEGIPMSILEAMANGLPVVAADVGGIGEIIDDGVDGFLVRERSPQAFSKAIDTLRDVGLRKRMGESARKKILEHFSAKSMAERYCDLYVELSD